MADVIVVMGDNRVQQVGAPLEVYGRPRNTFVADFIGTNNFLPGRVVDGTTVEALGRRFRVAVPPGLAGGAEVSLSVRPEKLALATAEPSDAPNRLGGTVTFVRDLGSSVETYVDVDGRQFVVVGAPHYPAELPVWLSFDPDDCVVLSA